MQSGGSVQQKMPVEVRIGADLMRVESVAESLRNFGARYLRRIYTEAEINFSTPMPLAAQQIVEGAPLTHATQVYESADGELFVAYWSSSAGRFTWDYTDINEVITILDGEAFVKTSDGKTHHLKPGVTLSFGKGDFAEWHVPRYIRKVAVVQRSPRPLFRRAADKIGKLFRG